ncbi:uncharacterized protein SCHCODRAFT_02600489 [Schizophyllum commune H4-8]|uniref:Uncharacterized protein n=1 Tax=Schizophyllum commune (strain H4-8 / FGSC 9210) TaxID=578458 RepID=D8Q7E6_SCHCM|nr:uncharacterized protein SCHCODRAFT_02600489 [Schizophyllum commune H4-8]KAI5891526.1 hypothetical protein SCHCODRAFT_02600489 [Schizophyllum commune H4-8]
MAKATESTKKKTTRRLRATSSVPPDDIVPSHCEDVTNSEGLSVGLTDEEGRPKNAFIDDEAEEDNAEETEIIDKDEYEFVDHGESTGLEDGVPAADNAFVPAIEEHTAGGATLEHAEGAEATGHTNENESDGEHSAHSLELQAAAASTPENNGSRPIDLYFASFQPNKASPAYQALLNDGCFEWTGISDYGYCNNVYKTIHLYKQGPMLTSSAWKPTSPTNFPDFQLSMRTLYPAFPVMKTICNTLAFSASSGFVNLSRVNPARFMFDDTNQTNAATLTRISDATTPAFCMSLGLIREAFVGPNGLNIEQAVRRGITLAPFECEAYRIFSCANEIAKFKDEDHFIVPLYSNGGILFATKPIGPDGRRPNVPGWTAVQTQKRQKPEMISDRSTQGRRKIGVLEYVDDIPIIDARRKPVAWGTDTFAQITNDKMWPRFTDNLERDAVAVVVYTVNRWGHEGMRRLTFNINAVVVVADNIEAVSAKAADTIERETASLGVKRSRLTRVRPDAAGVEEACAESSTKKRKPEDA